MPAGRAFISPPLSCLRALTLLRWRGWIVQGGTVCAAAVNLRVHLPHENVMRLPLRGDPEGD